MRAARRHFQLNKRGVYCATFMVLLPSIFGLSYADAKNIIAPYDAIVCFDSDFASCVTKTNANLSSLYDEMFEDSDGKLLLHPGLIAIPAPTPETTVTYNEKTIPSGTLSYQCLYDKLYEPNLKVYDKKAAAYISIPLFIILRNNLYKLQQAQEECHNLIITFNFEAGQFAAKKQLFFRDSVAEYLSNIIQWETYQTEKVGATKETDDQQAQWNLPAAQGLATENDDLLSMHELAAPQRALIRDIADDNLMMYYATKFGSAQRGIYSYEREVEGDLYLLDVGVVDLGGRSLNETMVPNDSWGN